MGFELFSPFLNSTGYANFDQDSFDPVLVWRQNEGLGMSHNIVILFKKRS